MAKLGTKTGQGMAIGAVAAATGGGSLLAAGFKVGATTIATGIADRALDTDATTAALDPAEVGGDAAGGFLGGALGAKAGQAVKARIVNSHRYKMELKTAKRWVRRVEARSQRHKDWAAANRSAVDASPAGVARRAAGAVRGTVSTAASKAAKKGIEAVQDDPKTRRAE